MSLQQRDGGYGRHSRRHSREFDPEEAATHQKVVPHVSLRPLARSYWTCAPRILCWILLAAASREPSRQSVAIITHWASRSRENRPHIVAVGSHRGDATVFSEF